MLCCAEWILNISIEQYNYANNISDWSQGQKIKYPSHRCRTPPSYGRAALQNSFKFIVFQPPFCSLGCKFWIVGSSSQSHSFPFHLSITLGQLPPNPPRKSYISACEKSSRTLLQWCGHMVGQEQLHCRITAQLSWCLLWWKSNPCSCLSRAVLAQSLCSDNLAQHTSSCSSQLSSVCVCCFVRYMLSILKSAAVINEQNFNLLSSSHVNVGAF